MGTSACLYHVRDCTQAQVLDAIVRADSPSAYVSDVLNDWATIADIDGDAFRQEAMEHTVTKVSQLLAADVVITTVYDDDISQYVAFHAGKVVDRFSTHLDGMESFEWLSARKFPGSPKTLGKAFPWFNGQALLEKAFNKSYTLESSRLKEIARAFGIPENRVLLTSKIIQTPQSARLLKALESLGPDNPIGASVRARQGFVEFRPPKPSHKEIDKELAKENANGD